MAATTIERRTNTLLSKINYTYNKPVSSSDLNESQAIALENVIKYLVGDIPASTLDISVASFSGSTTGLTIKSFKYLCRDDSNHYFYGSVTQDIFLGLNGAVSGNNYELYAYFRSLELDKDSTTYLNGIRSNEYQSGLTESTTPNNIFDDLLNEQVSTRVGLELTFFFRNSEVAGPPNISGWSTPVLVANVTLDTSTGKATISNKNPDINDVVDSIESELDNLSDEVNSKFLLINTSIEAINSNLGNLGTEVSQVKLDINSINSDIEELNESVNTLNESDSTNKSNITTLQNNFNSHINDFKLHSAVATTSGTSTALTASADNFTLIDGSTIKIKLNVDIGDNATINVNSLGAKNIITPDGERIKAGAKSGSYLTLIYNGTNFVVQGSSSDGGSSGYYDLVITFDSEFSGRPYTVSSSSESYEGTVPVSLKKVVRVKNGDTVYTISSSTSDDSPFSTTVTTDNYYGQYPVTLNAFTATLKVVAVANATVSVTGPATYNDTAGPDGSVTITIKKSGNYNIKASYDGCNSETKTSNINVNGQSYNVIVKFIRLTVNIETGSNVTVSNGSTNKSGTTSSNKIMFYLPNTGVWNITATKSGQSASGSINCNSYSDFNSTLTYVSSTLNNNSWDIIKDVSNKNLGDSYWDVGDRKQVSISGSVGSFSFSGNYYAFIIGFNHNSSREGTGITFQFGKTALSGGNDIAYCDSSYNTTGSSAAFRMNTSNTNNGGWYNSYMRKTICAAFKNALESSLRNNIKTVNKWTDNTGGGSDTASYVTSTSDSVFLPSEFEIQGTRSYANSAEKNYQQQYTYYKNGNSKIKNRSDSTSSACLWWLRSPRASYSYPFCSVHTNGNANYYDAYYSFGFAPCFVI